MKKTSNIVYPAGKDFIFTIFDDTDVATLEYIKPIYDFLADQKIYVTKSVWSIACDKECNDLGSHTLEDEPYAQYIRELDNLGFEIGYHGASMIGTKREEIIRSLEVFHNVLGKYPRIYAAHSFNQENLYWGKDRFYYTIFQKLYSLLSPGEKQYYTGHQKGSSFYWADLVKKHFDYVRNFTYNDINLLNLNKPLPYRDNSKQGVNGWFFTCDADNVAEFNELLSLKNQQKLVDERGVCIVTTHLGKGFNKNNDIHPTTKHLLLKLKENNGWFAPVSEVLDFLKAQSPSNAPKAISKKDLFLIESRWFVDSFRRRSKKRSYEKTEIPYLEQEKRRNDK